MSQIKILAAKIVTQILAAKKNGKSSSCKLLGESKFKYHNQNRKHNN